jgi:hypothetical protein
MARPNDVAGKPNGSQYRYCDSRAVPVRAKGYRDFELKAIDRCSGDFVARADRMRFKAETAGIDCVNANCRAQLGRP